MPYTTIEAILGTLDTLTRAELARVQVRLDSVLSNLAEQIEPEQETPETTPRYVEEYVSCGKASCKKCAGGQRGHGPYRYEVKYSGRVKHDVKRYVGKVKPTT